MEVLPVPPVRSGIYFLYDDEGDLMYVGKSRDVTNRIGYHERLLRSQFAWYIPYPPDLLDEKEWQYIHLLEPKRNVLDNPAATRYRYRKGGTSPHNTGKITLTQDELALIPQLRSIKK